MCGYSAREMCDIQAERVGGESGFARLTVSFTADIAPDGRLRPVTGDHRCMILLREFAERFTPAFGHVSYSYDGPTTALEEALLIFPPQTLYDSADYLRGYSWLTVVPSILATRLGGETSLRDSGAFATVDTLPNGSLWLLATHSWAEYRGDRIDAVFDALAPILPAGMPEDVQFPIPSQPPRLLSWRDASNKRGSQPRSNEN